MKKILFIVFLSFLFLSGFQNLFAQNISPTPKVVHVQYDLPYPGILPDSPLYFLKALRDNLIGFFISDPFKKADYDLLMADKRLGAAKLLLDSGKTSLAITTLSKSGNYFDQAIQKAAEAKSRGQNADPIISRLITAAIKHQEVISQMAQKTKGDTRYNLELLQIRARDFQDTAELLKSK